MAQRLKGFDFDRAQALREKRDQKREKRWSMVKAGRGYELLPTVTAEMSECEYQVEVALALSQLGYKCRLEMSTRCLTSRFDILAFWGDVPVAIIELEKHTAKQSASRCKVMDRRLVARQHSIQQGLYEDYGIPVYLLCGASKIREFTATVSAEPMRLVRLYNDMVPEARQVAVEN